MKGQWNSGMPFYERKKGNDISALLECRTVIEKNDYVATGALTYAQGEIIEVELPQFDVFQLGDKVKIIIYSKTGMCVFDSSVVAKENGSLIIINPPENRKRFVDKREHPRVDIQQSGLLSAIYDRLKGERTELEQPIPLAVSNISMSGAGFLTDFDLELDTGVELAMELDLGFPMICKSELIRKNQTDAGYFYGTRFLSVPDSSANALRAFVLKSQVEMYFRVKRLSREKEELG